MSDTFTIDTEEQSKPTATPYRPDVFSLQYGPLPSSGVLPDFDFDKFGDQANSFASTLVETCKKNNGLSLSANQCGFTHRVFVMGADDEYVAFFNPKIVSMSEDTIKLTENSLTIPLIELKLTRPVSIDVEYQDFHGETHVRGFGGLSSRLFQQQVDNLNGIMFIEHAKPLALQMAKKRQNKLFKRMGVKI